jgi:hypothetical protein
VTFERVCRFKVKMPAPTRTKASRVHEPGSGVLATLVSNEQLAHGGSTPPIAKDAPSPVCALGKEAANPVVAQNESGSTNENVTVFELLFGSV